ncbi:MAG: hypothetical protein AABX28_02260 [Nanoarchaeota archaeon]
MLSLIFKGNCLADCQVIGTSVKISDEKITKTPADLTAPLFGYIVKLDGAIINYP